MGLKSRIFCRTSVDPAVQRFYVHKNERLGKGNFALSFRATDRVDNSAVACKCFKLGKSKVIGSEILNEVQFLQELEHPNIVRMLAHGVSGREYVIVLEMLSKNLLQIVTESHGLPMPQALQYSRDILCGLAHCHSRGILHRDVKLENIMVDDKTGLVKLIDFGLSCTLGALSTDANPFVGTTSYLAPEVLDRKPYSFGCDIWSLGVVFFTMIFNVFPFKMVRRHSDVTAGMSSAAHLLPLPSQAHSVDLEFRKLSDLQKEGRKNSVCNALGSKIKATEAPESITTILDSFLTVDPTQRQPAGLF
mmetsp:Transcript_17381/g.39839  ORF Transcript_17381/g.39839 Transcript_17381/m.39839 type:complete len:305 (+) Transcript_17381:166-1080(+)